MSPADAQRESVRCERNIEKGGSVDFWLWRLKMATQRLDATRAILQKRIEWLERKAKELK